MQTGSAAKLTERYDREARGYRDLWAPLLRTAGLVLLRELAGPAVHRVADVGTGVGTLLPDLVTAFPGALVLGVDRSAGMLALAPDATPRAIMDAGALALASASIDRVLMVFMLFHLDSPAPALAEVRRVLRPGGRVGIITWGGPFDSEATRLWTECLDAHGAIPPDPDAAARHAAVDAPEKMQPLLRQAGFASARSWTGELTHTIEVEHLFRLKTGLGCAKTRFDSLAALQREACVAEARRRFAALAAGDFIARGTIVYSVAEA